LPKHREFFLHFIKNKWGNHKCIFHKNSSCEVYRVGNKTQLWWYHNVLSISGYIYHNNNVVQ
jgi:hypothetical protein